MLRTSSGGLRHSAHTSLPGMWWFAAFAIVAEVIALAVGAHNLPLAFVALAAPGFALAGLLPRPLRERPVSRALTAPVLGLTITALVLISIARLGIPLTAVSVHLVLVALVLLGLLVSMDDGAEPPRHSAARRRELRIEVALDALCLGAVLALALTLAWRVIGQLPVPGDDWAKYLLYADEIRRQGALLLQNTLWMGGRPFSEDPGVPALEGAALLLTGADAGGVVRVILGLQLLGIAAAFGTARVWFGRTGATVTGALLAAAPATQNILGWHGLANVGALTLMVLVLAQLAAWLDGELDRRGEIGLAVMLVGVAAFHRFTALFLAGTLAVMIAAALASRERRRLLLGAARVGVLGAAGGVLVALDLRQRASDAGGTLSYTSYLNTKVDLGLAIRDLSPVLVAIAAASVLVLVALRRLPRAAWPALAMACVAVALAFGYVAHVPLYYARVTFFLPLPLALLAGAGAAAATRAWAKPAQGRSPSTSRIVQLGAAGAAAGMVLGVMAVIAWRQADQVRQYYAFASPASLTALDDLATELAPDEVVVTDRCWSFLATWLLRTHTYPALEEQDIQPRAELVVARRSAAILRGTGEGRELMRSLPVRWAVLDPTCPVNGRRFFPPGRPVYAGARLAVIELNPDQKNPPAPDVRRPKRAAN